MLRTALLVFLLPFVASADSESVARQFLQNLHHDIQSISFQATWTEPRRDVFETIATFDVQMDRQERVQTYGVYYQLDEFKNVPTVVFGFFADGKRIHEINYRSGKETRWAQPALQDGVRCRLRTGLDGCGHGSYLKSWLGYSRLGCRIEDILLNATESEEVFHGEDLVVKFTSGRHRLYIDPKLNFLVRWDLDKKIRVFSNFKIAKFNQEPFEFKPLVRTR